MKNNSLLIYLLSYKNSLFINNWESLSFSSSKKSNFKLIGANHLGQMYLKNPVLYKVIYIFIFLLLPFLLYLYFIYIFIVTISKYLVYKKKGGKLNRLFLYTSNPIVRMSMSKNIFTKDDFLLVYPNEKCLEIPISQQIRILELININIIIRSFLKSLITFKFVIKKYGYFNSYYSFNSFSWYLLFYALNAVDKDVEIFMSNQKDRWAFLVDNLPHKKKNIIQHGTNIIKKISNKNYNVYCKYYELEDVFVLIMPIRLSNISKIYAFTELEAKCMILGEHRKTPAIEIIGYNMKLSIMDVSKPKILIIGEYNLNASIEERIISVLQNYPVEIFLKSHPSIKINNYDLFRRKFKFTIVEKDCFPKVDLVFSYNSTLALEYESFNIRVRYYNDMILDEDVTTIDNAIIQEIRDLI